MLVVLILLYVGSQVFSTLIATATADPTQRRMVLLLPLVFVVILYRYPAGLLVYWITTNLWTIGQQYLIRRHMGPAPPPTGKDRELKGEENPRTAARQSRAARLRGQPALAGVGTTGSTAAAPPRPPRKKKKRSGRRR